MQNTCKCCKNKIYLDKDTSANGYIISGQCDSCGAVINYEEDIFGNTIKDFSKCPSIDSVEVALDSDVPDYMEGIIRIGSITKFFDNGKSVESDELTTNEEFHSEKELIDFVAKKLKISSSIVSFI
ncbi:hypothetical protein ABE29_18110 [Cytobacillus firmus]|uniref:hypothetical protein n=1 Tax=Cytobacillus firmus TaxID=1399 RepID=UPI0018CF7344|nr:hypothetical protein [Cytobacillus firmus]MBG9544616.1 hypothetical protein [Cytobacillus firmus]MBG9553686.1 hypothetical protein [Cytobacillus firmus]MBG9575160.1 hypothetical protein [Cytobacillus firmus]MED4447559.1 hypothetical protein [Cytobacillus firmus]MED4769680.1 hypothetical protein [Cytobacillus firmus]